MQLFLYSQSGVFQCSFVDRQGAAMRTMNLAGGVKNFQVLPNGHLRSAKAFRKFRDQYAALRA
jgi:uncharacterized protein YigE (DUF2233 family)